MLDHSFIIPGTAGPLIGVRRDLLGGIEVTVDGQPAKRRRSRELSYDIPLRDGTVTELALTGRWTGLKAKVAGSELPLERRLPRFVVALMFLPLALGLLGGVVGVLVGMAGAAINARVARLPYGWPVRVAAMVGVSLLTVAVTFAIAAGLRG